MVCTISLGGLILNAGLLIFPINFLLSNLITEVYGYKHARRAVWCGFLFNLLFIVYGQAVIYMPSPNYSISNPLFDKLIAIYLKGALISITSYFAVEPLNLFFIAKLKTYMNGYHMKLRFVVATSLSITINGIILSLIKFQNSIFFIELLPTIFFIIITIVVSTPILVYLSKKIKTFEKIDMYDTNIKFNMFNFEANYTATDNKFYEDGQEPN